LFLVCLRELQENAVDKFEEFLNSLIQPNIFPTLDQQHIGLLIGAKDRDAFGFADGLKCEHRAVEGFNVDLVPGERLFEFIVEYSRDF
jgi:hypothetical protein